MASAGILISWDEDRRYGWLRPRDGGRDVFVGEGAIKASGLGSLPVGASVEYTVSTSRAGKPSAEELREV
jgi:cold shock protein